MPANHSTSMLQRFHRMNEFYCTAAVHSIATNAWVKDAEKNYEHWAGPVH